MILSIALGILLAPVLFIAGCWMLGQLIAAPLRLILWIDSGKARAAFLELARTLGALALFAAGLTAVLYPHL